MTDVRGADAAALAAYARLRVADHPDDCRGTCREDARREAEAQANADSDTEPLAGERRT